MKAKYLFRLVATFALSCASCLTALPHGSGTIHVREMYSVLPFRADENGNATSENKAIANWLKLITGKLIDGYKGEPVDEFGGLCFYDYLRENFNFHCKHRLLFHWGFNAKPWNEWLDKKVGKTSWGDNADSVAMFKQAFITEQARRNRIANTATEELFGFAAGGTEAAWANGIISVVYDVHLLGDYVLDDNSDFDGVTPPSKVAGDIIGALHRIDAVEAKPLIKQLSALTSHATDEHQLAAQMILLLQEKFPTFLLSANEGSLKRRFQKQGFTFK